MKVMILAAGRGERMGSLTEDRPKPMLEVAGMPLIEHQVRRLADYGLRELVINLGYRGDQIRAHLGNGQAFGVDIAWSDEGHPALDTGGGIRRALPLLGPGPFGVVNADVWCDLSPARMRALGEGLPPDDLAHLWLVPNPEHHSEGDFALDGDRVRDTGTQRLTFSGLSVLRPALFDNCTEERFGLAPLLRRAIAEGRVEGARHDGVWADIGTPERLEALRRQLAA